jgi:NADPH:quinone reductase-like Zn-dependent oxidoreductase
MIQLLKAHKCQVIASTSAQKHEYARKLGADHTVDYKSDQNFSETVRSVTGKRGVDRIFDPVMSGPSFNENLKSLAMDAKFVIYGSMGGPKLTEDA